MDTVGITVQLSKYQATVHYESCSYYSPTYHHSKLPLPPSIKWKVCSFCKPGPEDVAEVAGEVTWLEKPADAMSRLVDLSEYDDEVVDRMVVQYEDTGGRKMSKNKKYWER